MPLQIAPRGGNMPIKTITVSTPNSGSLDASNIHRNLSGNTANLQATTIMPIAKIVSQQQQQNLVSAAQVGNQSTPVFIHTRINAPTISSSVTQQQSSQVVTVSTPSSMQSGGYSTGSTTVYYEPAISMSIAPSSIGGGGGVSGEQTKTTASSMSNNESSTSSSSYTVVSGPNVRYNDNKMIHSIIANSYHQHQQQQQQQNANNSNLSSIVSNQSQPVRYSPLVVENQTSAAQNQSQHHQIITMAPGTIIQQTSQASHHQQQHHGLSVEAIAANILSSLPSSSHCAIRKNETTPVKMNKKATKVKCILIVIKDC